MMRGHTAKRLKKLVVMMANSTEGFVNPPIETVSVTPTRYSQLATANIIRHPKNSIRSVYQSIKHSWMVRNKP